MDISNRFLRCCGTLAIRFSRPRHSYDARKCDVMTLRAIWGEDSPSGNGFCRTLLKHALTRKTGFEALGVGLADRGSVSECI